MELSLNGEGFVVNGWWHSHVNMSVFESGTDSSMTEDLLQFTPIVVTLITNKNGDLYTGITIKIGDKIIFINKDNIETVIVPE
jgi:proteasome lid subunit RPN8/RPN11